MNSKIPWNIKKLSAEESAFYYQRSNCIRAFKERTKITKILVQENRKAREEIKGHRG